MVLPYKKNDLSRHRDVDQEVCFREARGQATRACVSHREEMITGRSEQFGLLLYFVQHVAMSELNDSLNIGQEWTQHSRVLTSGGVSRN